MLGSVTLNGKPINPKQMVVAQPGDLIVLNTPGGGGYGDPAQRDPWREQADMAAGLVNATKMHADDSGEVAAARKAP